MSTSKQIVEVIYSIFTDNNLSRALPVLDEHLVLYMSETVPFGGEYHGRSGFLSMMATMYEHWKSPRLTELTYFIPEDGLLENHIITTGKLESYLHQGDELMAVPFIHYWTLNDGKIVEWRTFHWDIDQLHNRFRGDKESPNFPNNGFQPSDNGHGPE